MSALDWSAKTLVQRLATWIAAAALGAVVGLAGVAPSREAESVTVVDRATDCQAAVAYADQLVSEYAEAYSRALESDLDEDQVAEIQQGLAEHGAAYVARREACEDHQ